MYIVTAGASALAGNVIGGLFGGGGGGSGGGSAPPVYQPKDQAGRDQNFLDMQNNYQQLLRGQYDVTNPYNQSMFAGQMNNPYAGGYQTAANNAGTQYQTNANFLNEATDYAWRHADQANAWGNQVAGNMQGNSTAVQNGFNGMYDLANQSNNVYNALLKGMGGQQSNVTNAAQQMYGSAGALQQTAFDPQGSLYRQNLGDLVANTRAAEYARGIQMSPAGASVEADALGRFQNDWQNQQLAREVQGVGAMGQANQTGLGLTTNYVNNIAGLQSGMNTNYGNLVGGAANMMAGWDKSQAEVNAMNARTNATNVATASSAGDAAAQAALNAGQVPYQAYQAQYGNQQTALNNYMGNNQPYYQGMNQLMSNDLGYMFRGTQAQNQAFDQNMQNAQFMNKMGQQIAGAGTFGNGNSLGNSVWGWLGNWQPNTSAPDYSGNYTAPDYGIYF